MNVRPPATPLYNFPEKRGKYAKVCETTCTAYEATIKTTDSLRVNYVASKNE